MARGKKSKRLHARKKKGSNTMKKDRHLFTSESVSEGHPDKMCDQISDAVLDAFIAQDPSARVACEALVARNQVIVAGEITAKAKVDIPAIARKVIQDIGYTKSSYGFDDKSCEII